MYVFIFGAFAFISKLYFGAVFYFWLRQRKFQYHPSHEDKERKGNLFFHPWIDHKNKFLGYFRPYTSPPRSIVLFFHGNSGEALHRDWVRELVPTTSLLYMAEYPGYGGREGVPSEEVIFSDAEYLVEQLRREWGKETPLIVLGESLGTGPACYLASKNLVDRVALISPFSSAYEVALLKYKFLPVKLLMKDKFDSKKHVQSAKVPLHIIHGTQDELVPIFLGKKLFEAYPNKNKKFSEVPGVNHTTIKETLLHSPFCYEFRRFLTSS